MDRPPPTAGTWLTTAARTQPSTINCNPSSRPTGPHPTPIISCTHLRLRHQATTARLGRAIYLSQVQCALLWWIVSQMATRLWLATPLHRTSQLSSKRSSRWIITLTISMLSEAWMLDRLRERQWPWASTKRLDRQTKTSCLQTWARTRTTSSTERRSARSSRTDPTRSTPTEETM